MRPRKEVEQWDLQIAPGSFNGAAVMRPRKGRITRCWDAVITNTVVADPDHMEEVAESLAHAAFQFTDLRLQWGRGHETAESKDERMEGDVRWWASMGPRS